MSNHGTAPPRELLALVLHRQISILVQRTRTITHLITISASTWESEYANKLGEFSVTLSKFKRLHDYMHYLVSWLEGDHPVLFFFANEAWGHLDSYLIRVKDQIELIRKEIDGLEGRLNSFDQKLRRLINIVDHLKLIITLEPTLQHDRISLTNIRRLYSRGMTLFLDVSLFYEGIFQWKDCRLSEYYDLLKKVGMDYNTSVFKVYEINRPPIPPPTF